MSDEIEQAATDTLIVSDFWTLINSDDTVISDLESVGIVVESDADVVMVAQERRDMMASMFMRRQSEELEAIAQLERSRDMEIRWTMGRYAVELDARRVRARQLGIAALAIAEHTKTAGGYDGKKKSRNVGAGTYGYRSYSESLEITDELAYIMWAEEHAPATLRVKPAMTLLKARGYLTPQELVGVKREVIKAEAKLAADVAEKLPAGFAKVPASNEFYAKPLPAAAMTGAAFG